LNGNAKLLEIINSAKGILNIPYQGSRSSGKNKRLNEKKWVKMGSRPYLSEKIQ
jgi:hypothetical protein